MFAREPGVCHVCVPYHNIEQAEKYFFFSFVELFESFGDILWCYHCSVFACQWPVTFTVTSIASGVTNIEHT